MTVLCAELPFQAVPGATEVAELCESGSHMLVLYHARPCGTCFQLWGIWKVQALSSPDEQAACIGTSFPQWWDFWRSSFPHATAQILPVDKTSLAYRLLGTGVMSSPQNPKVLWEQAGHNRLYCYLPDSQSHNICVCRRTHEASSLLVMKGKVKLKSPLGEPTTPWAPSLAEMGQVPLGDT